MSGWRYRLASWLHHKAGRIHPDFDFRSPGWSFTIEPHKGMVWHHTHLRGCPVWYRHSQYEKAFRTQGRGNK